jgi:hypothetical protein
MINSKMGASGTLGIKVIKPPKAPLSYRLKNSLRWSFLTGWMIYHLAGLFTRITKIPTLRSRLTGRVIYGDGRMVDLGVLGYRSITNAGVAFLVDDWDSDAQDITTMNYHACGVGTTAENVTDTGPETERNARASGTKSQPSANVLQSVATISNTGTFAITEHVLMSAVTGGTAWDRTVFAALNLTDGDSLQTTYQCTVSAGG